MILLDYQEKKQFGTTSEMPIIKIYLCVDNHFTESKNSQYLLKVNSE